ncbi:MAG: M28 family peptidase, partial [Deltaproteobacteria bacterium]|nr:M28 family peptidase [Deltaproteobacteria bacterium]
GNMAEELADTAKSLGYGAKVSQMPFGGGSTDAASFAQIGVEASCLLAFELDISNLQEDMVYHTPRDKTNAIEPKVVEQSLNVAVQYLLKKDKELL